MDSTPSLIRTPDQRLRVFVSSTLKELGEERKFARAAIERLHLAPVMFELGARPHPPRELYRAYLAQSDVFVGLYWERYGWVAPGENVSGLEDEYILEPALPKLMYIKETVGQREPRLSELLDRIRTDDAASFKYFSTARELSTLLEGDLAVLLAERFDQSRAAAFSARSPQPVVEESVDVVIVLPTPMTPLIGREREVSAIESMVGTGGQRLVTLTGPGGIGKSRLAIEVANRLSGTFGGATYFVDLSAVHDLQLVSNAIADAIGVRDTGDIPLMDKITRALRTRKTLLVLDNFEQIIGAAAQLTTLLAAVPGLSLLVTSRTLLRVAAERGFEVGSLSLPAVSGRTTLDEVLASAAVALFVERIHAVKPDFEVTDFNYLAIARICVALDGVPLALELAAARIRVLPPAAMLARLDRRLPLLVGGARDLPERQQTLRRTIEWSTQLLDSDEKALLATLGVFDGGFSLEAVEAVAAPGLAEGADTLTLLGRLVDNSLVRQEDRRDRAYFSILSTVREYSLEDLERSGELAGLRERHARYFVERGEAADRELLGPQQRQWMEHLADDRDNLRAAVRYLLEQHRWDDAARFAWSLYIYWWVDGNRGEVVGWMAEVLAAGDTQRAVGQQLSDLARAIALYYTRAITFWQDPDDRVVPGLTESADLFHREHNAVGEALALVSLALAVLSARQPDPNRALDALHRSLALFREASNLWGQSMAQITLGRVELLQLKLHGALDRFQQSLALTRQVHDQLGETIALYHVGWANLLLGDRERARDAFEESLALSVRLGHDEGTAYGLEGLVAIAAVSHNIDRAGRLLGAAECLRETIGIYNAANFSFHQRFVDEILAGNEAEEFIRARAEGRGLSAKQAAEYARPASAPHSGAPR